MDASLTGIGACMAQANDACPLSQLIVLDHNMLIVHLEMINIRIALRVWSTNLQGKPVIFHCKNSAVVSIIQIGQTKDLFRAAVARNIWIVNIDLTVVHILGKANFVADVLSRWFIPRTNKNLSYQNITKPEWYYFRNESCIVDDQI